MKTKKLTIASLFIAIGVVTGNLIYIPIGASKCFPMQGTINVLSGILLGPGYGVIVAFCISLLRNILGTGTLLAFPGSMIGAFLAGYLYLKTKKSFFAVLGEVFGTGILGALLSFPIAKLIMGKEVGALFYIVPFLISTVGGSLIAYLLVRVLSSTKLISLNGKDL
ncbi:energy coupling factor transporter S component ThiW [Clostridium sp. 'White wine YQ']|uniref:energy coupling factor transporter S component ThiW n=1 Tax=Clostridium sp. 'White wine YQ' TaxID=3027474 RepID=UPI0023657A7A|nr:energy coupling factor transporter S component ThiW [Clostridium sp. 'White wine YQ']MDD7796197.1 energy coupling factor transporter S component ThiW [Clostridium sp. 'White wine YQ']